MPALIYIHGFLSSPASHKALQVKHWLAEHRPDVSYHCPALSAYPQSVRETLEALVVSLQGEDIYLMGSSLGGFWSTWLAEQYNVPAILINPAVKPSMLLPEYLGIELKNYHTDETYRLSQDDMTALRAVDIAEPQRPDNYWLLAQTGDETLDYREAVEKYRLSKQTIEEGGDHSFQDFENWIPETLRFCDDFYKKTV